MHGDVGVDNSRLYHDALIGEIHLKDAVHASQADDYTLRDGQRAAAQSSPGAAGDERDFLAAADFHDPADLLGRVRQQYSLRQNPKIRQTVAFIRAELFGCSDESSGADEGLKLLQNCKIHRTAL